jgi:hypothetical protein
MDENNFLAVAILVSLGLPLNLDEGIILIFYPLPINIEP